MESVSGIGRPCFLEEDDASASLAGMEAGFSGSNNNPSQPLFSRSFCHGRRGGSFKNLASFSPRSAGFYNGRFQDDYQQQQQQQTHFLESCFLCNKPLGDNRDIFMYRGDTPFCSEECRQEQIEIDEAQDNKNWNLSSSMKTLRQKDQRKSSISPTKDQSYPARAGTVAAG